jgi:hypothetical protein
MVEPAGGTSTTTLERVYSIIYYTNVPIVFSKKVITKYKLMKVSLSQNFNKIYGRIYGIQLKLGFTTKNVKTSQH